MDKRNQVQQRHHNRSLLMATLLLRQPLSRADLARETGLNKVTVSEIVAECIADGQIEEVGTGESRGGRRPTLLSQASRAGIAIAMNLAPGELTILSTWLDGLPIDRERTRPFEAPREAVIATLIAAIDEELHHLDQVFAGQPPTVAGFAIAIHGNVMHDEILFTPNYDLAGLDLVEQLRARYDFPIWIGNEANFTALGELATGTSAENFVALSIHTGVGAGLIRDSDLDLGRQGFAGEVGHMVVVPDGLPCPCGNRGCVEQYVSDRAVLRRWRERAGHDDASLVDLIRGIRDGDEAARAVAEHFVHYMGILVNNLNRLLDPERIVINARLTAALPGLIDEIAGQNRCQLSANAPLRASLLGDPAGLYGAIATVLRHHYHVRRLRFAAFKPVGMTWLP